MRLAARCSQKLLVSISYVPFRAAGYAKSDHPKSAWMSVVGHETDMPKYLGDVRCWVNSGKHMLAWSISGLDQSGHRVC